MLKQVAGILLVLGCAYAWAGMNAAPGITALTGDVTASGSGSVAATVDATDANTASKIVKRDASGNFAAGTVTASLTGAASLNATKALDNLASVALNADLICASSGSCNLGSQAKPFASAYVTTLRRSSDGEASIDINNQILKNGNGTNVMHYSNSYGVFQQGMGLYAQDVGSVVTITGGASGVSHTLNFPGSQGAANTHMQNDGAGVLSWRIDNRVIVQGAASTPTCAAGNAGEMRATSVYAVCICNGSVWKDVATGVTTCSF